MSQAVSNRSSFLSMGRILRLGAAKFGGQSFLEFEGRTHTYAAFNAQTNVVAEWLASADLKNGDRMLIVSDNNPNFVRALFAASKLGIVSMPANTMLTARDIAALIDLARPGMVLVAPPYAERVAEAVATSYAPDLRICLLRDDELQPWDGSLVDVVALAGSSYGEPVPRQAVHDDDAALILFSSGSTGTPKGIVKSHSNVAWSAINHQISEPRRRGDRELFCLSLAGIAFANFLLVDALSGATCVLERSFDAARVAESLRSRGISHLFIAPTMVSALIRRGANFVFPTVKVVETSFEFPLELRQAAVRMFPHASILWSFGSTEATMARSPEALLLTDVTCVGYASGLDEYRIDPAAPEGEPAEIHSFGPTVMLRYLDPGSLGTEGDNGIREDGWFATGDVGRLDEQGALHFVGRVKDMIKTGGANVFAAEVENVLIEHPAVHNAAVIGLSDSYWGEVVAAVIEVDDTSTVDLRSIEEFAAERLAPFRRPKHYFVVSELPKNPTGKIAKGQLRDQFTSVAVAEGRTT